MKIIKTVKEDKLKPHWVPKRKVRPFPIRAKTYREYTPKLTDLRYIFPDETTGQPFAIVKIDYLAIPKPIPDVYAMAGETGYTLVGLSVAMSVQNEIASTDQIKFLQNYYQTFLTQDQYNRTQQLTFEIMSRILPQISEEMIVAGYYLSALPLGIYIGEYNFWLDMLLRYQILGLNILTKLYESKEFSFYETCYADPVFGSNMFKKFSLLCPPEWNFNDGSKTELEYRAETYNKINYNLMGPWRFEKQIESHSTELRQDQTIRGANIYNDTVEYIQDQDGIGLIDVQVSFSGSMLRNYDKLIITYTNYPITTGIEHSVADSTMVARRFLFDGSQQIGQYFRAVSQFILQPLAVKQIINDFQQANKIPFSQDNYYLWCWSDNRPRPINTNEKQNEYKFVCEGVNYGKVGSGIYTILLKKSVRQYQMTGEPV